MPGTIRVFAAFVIFLFASSTLQASDFLSDGDCYIDPISGRQVCPLKKAAAATGKVLQAAANVVTPNNVALPMQSHQHYALPSQQVASLGWSKSWHKVHGQPVRNIGRRIFGK